MTRYLKLHTIRAVETLVFLVLPVLAVSVVVLAAHDHRKWG